MNFSKIAGAAPALVQPAKATLLWYVQNRSDYFADSIFQQLHRFIPFCAGEAGGPIESITAEHVLNYRSHLDPRHQWYLSVLSGVLQKWHALGYAGVDDGAVCLLRDLRLKGNLKGEAVLTMDPEDGPFTELELEAIQAALNDAYATGGIDLRDYVLVWLFMALAARPVQFAALKVCDLAVDGHSDGSATYTLRVPRAKQRGQSIRSGFKHRVLAAQLGELVARHAEEVRHEFGILVNDPSKLPLFPTRRSRMKAPAGFEFHMTAQTLGSRVKTALETLGAMSERTGQPINITATRFRRTLGTRAAMDGHGELLIAELLDHTDTQNVGVYVEARPEIVERIDKALALQMAPLAQAFAGMIVYDETDAVRGDDPTSRILDPRFDTGIKPMGTCGKYGFCGFAAPIACYTCRNFQPWIEGPHESVLDHLLAERERLMANGDTRVAAINDRTILAVAEVVRRCHESRCETDEVANG